jgi:RNA polymerase sigma-70 factor (ECF subfamily)
MGSEALIERAKSGDLNAFEEILTPLVEPAHRFACALLQDPQLAEDAVQEASVRAWRKLSRLREGSPLRPWFLGIVANQCRNQKRDRWWRVVRLPEPAGLAQDSPESEALRRAELREALGRLGDRERRVLILRSYLDLPWREVAAVTGLTEAGARTRYYRALHRLRPAGESREVVT